MDDEKEHLEKVYKDNVGDHIITEHYRISKQDFESLLISSVRGEFIARYIGVIKMWGVSISLSPESPFFPCVYIQPIQLENGVLSVNYYNTLDDAKLPVNHTSVKIDPDGSIWTPARELADPKLWVSLVRHKVTEAITNSFPQAITRETLGTITVPGELLIIDFPINDHKEFINWFLEVASHASELKSSFNNGNIIVYLDGKVRSFPAFPTVTYMLSGYVNNYGNINYVSDLIAFCINIKKKIVSTGAPQPITIPILFHLLNDIASRWPESKRSINEYKARLDAILGIRETNEPAQEKPEAEQETGEQEDIQDSQTLPKAKRGKRSVTPKEQQKKAVNDFYRCASQNGVILRDFLNDRFDYYVDESTFYRWAREYKEK